MRTAPQLKDCGIFKIGAGHEDTAKSVKNLRCQHGMEGQCCNVSCQQPMILLGVDVGLPIPVGQDSNRIGKSSQNLVLFLVAALLFQ